MCPPAAAELLDQVAHLARERRASLAALARREGLGPEDAVDCVQEALCALLDIARRGELQPTRDEPLASLLAGIVRNTARNRRRRHFRALPHETIDAHEPPDNSPPADEQVSQAEEHHRLRACVRGLCETQRAVVTLRMLEQRPGEDVAASLGISSNHVAVLLYRAQRSLRACMAGE
jgi:RNA polymerase sigma-70 factor (ECF subfamily)